MEIMVAAAMIVTSFFTGVFSLLLYMLLRMMQSDGWDDSNITNALRLLSHVTIHPEDFGAMYYLTKYQQDCMTDLGEKPERPFWYVSEDEFEGVVRTRP